MSKSIKLSEPTYARLLDYTVKRETFDQAVSRLLRLAKAIEQTGVHIPGCTPDARGKLTAKEVHHGT